MNVSMGTFIGPLGKFRKLANMTVPQAISKTNIFAPSPYDIPKPYTP